MKKTCRKCKISKPIEQFGLKDKKPYVDSFCKKCRLQIAKEWIKNNPEKYKVYQKKYQKTYKRNRAQANEYQRKWRAKNKLSK